MDTELDDLERTVPPLTQADGLHRRRKRGKTHCMRGHLLDAANTKWRLITDPKGRKYRIKVCIECSRRRR